MNIDFVWCSRQSTCKFCGSEIQTGSPMIIQNWYNRRFGWKQSARYHHQCWVELQLARLEDEPKPVSFKRGRPKLNLSAEDMLERKRLLKAYGRTEDIKEQTKIVGQLNKLGGIPSKWNV